MPPCESGHSRCTRIRSHHGPKRSANCVRTCNSSTSTILTRSLLSPAQCRAKARLRRSRTSAIALASAGQRVLAIEADLRRPKLADLLGVERSIGLTSTLAGQVTVQEAIQHWSGGVFDVLASGPLPPNPSELLASRQMQTLLDELRGEYDVILIDTPPLLPVTDAAALAPATDGALLVCRFKDTSRDQIRDSVGALEAVSASLLGTVFTMVPSTGPRAYGQYNSYYRTEQSVALTLTTPAPSSAPVTSPVKALPIAAPTQSHGGGAHRSPRPVPHTRPNPTLPPHPRQMPLHGRSR